MPNIHYVSTPRLNVIRSVLEKLNEPEFRFTQICQAIFKDFCSRYSEIQGLPPTLKEALIEALGDEISTLKVFRQFPDQQTTKVLFGLADYKKVEAVNIHYQKGNQSLCISCQVGCACACDFCLTGRIGFKRNLTADEIVDEAIHFLRQGPLDSISFMGMGEPLLNPNIFDALTLLTDEHYMGISRRKISISTVGIPEALQRLIKEFPQVNITYSLHSPFANERSKLIPMDKSYPAKKILPILDHYIADTKRKVYIAYTVIAGFNDTPEHAIALKQLLSRPHVDTHLYCVTLLHCNTTKENPHYVTDEKRFHQFEITLRQLGMNVTARASLGSKTYAACGQLSAEYRVEGRKEK